MNTYEVRHLFNRPVATVAPCYSAMFKFSELYRPVHSQVFIQADCTIRCLSPYTCAMRNTWIKSGMVSCFFILRQFYIF